MIILVQNLDHKGINFK